MRATAIPRQLAAWRREIRTEAQRFVGKIAESLRGHRLRVRTIIKEGLPEVAIVTSIGRATTDLAILGSRGLSGIPRFLLGSVSEHILSAAPCSILVVRGPRKRRGEHAQGVQVVLAFDGSPDAKAALAFLGSLGLPRSSRVTLLHVTERREDAVAWLVATGRSDLRRALNRAVEASKQQAGRVLERIRQRLGRKGLQAETVLADGHPADEILNVAERQHADLIVVGSRGLTGLQRILFGSVSRKVARHAPCSVLVVRSQDR
jgi:nucleotide-binding universal stress UspA family protein